MTVILAIVGQTVGLLHTMYQQTNVDVFFLDWEKPRRVLAREGAGCISLTLSLNMLCVLLCGLHGSQT